MIRRTELYFRPFLLSLKFVKKQISFIMAEYDFLIVGAGLYGCVFAHELKKLGKKCLVIDKRAHLGGNVYCEETEGINVHKYGAHIFHTSNKKVWSYVNDIVEFNRYTNSPVARYKNELYNLPFNMNTFAQMWSVKTPDEAQKKLDEQKADALASMKAAGVSEPRNLEEQALTLIGKDIYEKLIKGYTEKQWGRKCTELPAFIIKRLPVRMVFDNNYFNDTYQGIPIGGYNRLTDKLLEGIETRTGVDYTAHRAELSVMAHKTLYTGAIDEYFNFKFGHLQYRTVRFETETLDMPNYQGNAVVNYTSAEVPFTRIIEHKHFEFGTQPKTIISREYSTEWKPSMEPYYPVNDAANSNMAAQYAELAQAQRSMLFGGRLAEYKYYDMDKVVASALNMARKEFQEL